MKRLTLIFLIAALWIFAAWTEEFDGNQDFLLFERDGFVFSTYLRAGAYVNSDLNMVEGGGNWDVEGGYNGMRFMNEGNYSEWLLGYESPRDKGKWWGGAYVRFAYDIPDFGQGWQNVSDSIYLPEAYFRMGFPGQKWNLWVGRRYNEKVAVEMLDYYVANLDGNGGGAEGIHLGGATMDVNWLFSYQADTDGDGDVDDDDPVGSTENAYLGKQTFAFVIKNVAAGSQRLSFILAPSFQGGGDNGIENYAPGGGIFAAVKYDFDNFFGLDGGSQYYASAGFGTGANQHADTSLSAYDVTDWSVFAGVQGFALVNEKFSFKTTLHYEHRSYENMENWISLGLRPLVKLTPIFGLQFEYDFEAAIDTGDMVNRITLAPTFMPPNGNVNTGMQIMPFITYGYGDFKDGGSNISIGSTNHGLTWGLFGSVGF